MHVDLDGILTDVHPKFGIALKDPLIEVVEITNMHTGAIAYSRRPDLFNTEDVRHLNGIKFMVPEELSTDEDLVTAYFAHECSHLELMKTKRHIAYFVALTGAVHLTKPMQDVIDKKSKIPSQGLPRYKTWLGFAVRTSAYIPLAFYANQVEAWVDRNASKKGYASQINKLREQYPLKTFGI